MAELVERQTVEQNQIGDQIETTRSTQIEDAAPHRAANKIIQIVYFVGGLIMVLVGIRFVLQLLGASQASGFVNLIYNLTEPLVAPFYGIFQTTVIYGTARLETESLVALCVYALLTWGVAQLVRLLK